MHHNLLLNISEKGTLHLLIPCLLIDLDMHLFLHLCLARGRGEKVYFVSISVVHRLCPSDISYHLTHFFHFPFQ